MSVPKVTVVGAGLAGTLLAIRMAQRGYRVRLFERLPDMRQTELPAGRSINLALSDRGFKALRMIGLEDDIRAKVIPMYGRMIHDPGKEPWLSRYSGREHEFINSVSRPGLNSMLLDAAETYPNLEVYFQHSCSRVDLSTARSHFITPSGATVIAEADIVFGTDGAGSAVRRSLFDHSGDLRFNFSQQFLDHGYKELQIPPGDGGSWRIEKNALHIWPRQKYMLIALPNLDGSFTVTLFLPFEGSPGFNQLRTREDIHAFFTEIFPSAFAHMPTLAEDFLEHPAGILGTIKCYPWHAYGKVLVLGDAAHAVVPFYGQGMNCAMEDVVVLDEMIALHEGDWTRIFEAYQAERKKDADAIADLAVENYYEMRDHVDNADFILKRKIEMQLEAKYPAYSSKYNLVTFNEDVPYSEAMRKGHQQDAFLLDYCRNRQQIDDVDMQDVARKLGITS